MSSTTDDPQGSANTTGDSENIHACADKVLPPELAGDALASAINERRDNIVQQHATPAASVDGPAMAVVAKRLWKPGRTLHVTFIDKPPLLVRQKVEHYARVWEQFANIKFVFGKTSNAEIRITCTPGDGSWSWLGTEALEIPPDQPTMNYGWFDEHTADSEFERTTLHEFGHALGCIHEHQSPTEKLKWNVDAVYAAFGGPPNNWDRATIESNILDKYSHKGIHATVFDRHSIMLYQCPAELFLDHEGTPLNTKLSAKDKAYIARLYPRS
jgi:hypothetical protein